MRRFYHIVEGDPLDNGHDSQVMRGSPECRIEGPDQRMRNQAFLGHSAWCGVCKIAGKIAAGPGTPGFNLRMYDDTIQAHEAVEGDIVLCNCERPPKLVAVYGRISSIWDNSGDADSVSGFVQAAFEAPMAVPPARPSAGPPPPEQEMEREKAAERRCTLRIGVFFDGTLNNAGNTDLSTQCRASTGSALGQSAQEQAAIADHCQSYMADAGSSYGGGYTNVWRLYNLYQDSTKEPLIEGQREYFIPIYVEGIGTVTGERDDLLGMGFGIGGTGILAKVEQTLVQAIPNAVKRFAELEPSLSIDALEFDVFGFSRGAAAARHFVNQIHHAQPSPLAQKLPATQARLAQGFDASKDIRVGFVGLFDTVVAHASLADGFNVRSGRSDPINVALPAGCARQVVQLTARDEHRANFMLTTVAPQHREIALPGVHSDIGGGYRDMHEGPLMLIKPLRSVETPIEINGRSYRPLPEHTRAWQQAQAERSRWKARLGDIEDRCLTTNAWIEMEQAPPAHGSVVRTRQPVAYATLGLDRPIDWRYQLIPLRVMYKLAEEAGVPLDAIDDSEPAYALPPELMSISVKLLAGQPLLQDEETLLARAYLHQSANWNLGKASEGSDYRGGRTIDLLYINRPEPPAKGSDTSQRVVLPNENR
ncbi:type IV secretion protein Rhs [Dyella sp. M7H15-1]|uniref:PAAR domain-containing protein n=1 Tax=Dyella sp. M7H15-1 TaxID=2501295 RepID=UPI0010051DB2|nr:PAAR domain-containing protein [Dyella sp. M7H15-1]QAU24193.1 type IV secretion protein Rhs [Dyella sp. M7H15-1]